MSETVVDIDAISKKGERIALPMEIRSVDKTPKSKTFKLINVAAHPPIELESIPFRERVEPTLRVVHTSFDRAFANRLEPVAWPDGKIASPLVLEMSALEFKKAFGPASKVEVEAFKARLKEEFPGGFPLARLDSSDGVSFGSWKPKV